MSEPGSASASAIDLRDVQFSYRPGREVLRIPQFTVERGERVFLFGPSGSGKTTLLGILAGVLQAQRGQVNVLGQDLARLSGARRDRFRGVHLGYIFQMFNLIPYLSVLENIGLPCQLHPERRQRLGRRSIDDAARELAARLGISSHLHDRVTDLSVGQQQRVAACRALIGAPELVIADEPTSALDFDHRERFLKTLFDNCDRSNSTLLFVSHDRSLMPLFSRVLSLTEINREALAGVQEADA